MRIVLPDTPAENEAVAFENENIIEFDDFDVLEEGDIDGFDLDDLLDDGFVFDEIEDIEENEDEDEEDGLNFGLAAAFADAVGGPVSTDMEGVEEPVDKPEGEYSDPFADFEDVTEIEPAAFEDVVEIQDVQVVEDQPVKVAVRRNKGFFVKYPAAAAAAVAVLFLTPVMGLALVDVVIGDNGEDPAGFTSQGFSNLFNGNSSDPDSPAGNSNASQSEEPEADIPAGPKTLPFELEGPGHIEPISNCKIDGATGTITVEDASKNASFRIVRDVEGASFEIHCGDTIVDGEIVVLKAGSEYPVMSMKFVDEVALQRQRDEEAAVAAAIAAEAERVAAEQAAAAAAAAAAAESTTYYEEPTYYEQPVQTYQAPAQTYQEPAPAPAPAPVYQEPAPTYTPPPAAPAITIPMTSDEWAVAGEIFDAYNNYRASNGLNRVGWSDSAASMAYGSATGCSRVGSLQHRLGIPGNLQGCYSDILMFSTWRISGPDAVSKWHNSTGHRRMMKCPSATEAGVGAYFDGGRWYYAIVYNFAGCNQMING